MSTLNLQDLRKDRQGRIEACISNVAAVVRDPDICGIRLRLKASGACIETTSTGSEVWRSFTDIDYTRLRVKLETLGFGPVSQTTVKSVVRLVAGENEY